MHLIIHTDGGSRANPGPAAYGVVFILNGSVVYSTHKYLGVATNNEAEYQGLIAALQFVPQFLTTHPGIKSVTVKMDSNLVVQQVNGRWKVKEARLLALVQTAQAAREAIAIPVQLEYVPRRQNMLADREVNICLDTALA